MKKSILGLTLTLVVLAGLLGGCGSKVVAIMQQVQTVDQAVAAFGPPNQSMQLDNGNTVLVWASRRVLSQTVYRPSSYNVYANTGQQVGTLQGGSWDERYYEGLCHVKIVASPSGQILSKDVVGNDCK